MTKKLTLRRLQTESIKRMPEIMAKSSVPSTEYDMYYSLALAGEVGEFCNLLKKVKRGSRKLNKCMKKEMRHELADIQIYLVELAEILGVDLEAATIEKFNLVSKKYGCKILL